jgi:GT2 family glycosyltransferase
VTERLAAVIVHWQDADETVACVESLATEPPALAIVVDNGSREPIAARLAAQAPHVRVIRVAQNRGYAGGANVGIAAALADGARVVLLLNNDARVGPGAEAAALAALAADARIAVVGAKVLTREDPSRLWLAWGRVTYRQSLVALCGADVPDGKAWSVARDVDWVAGCAMWFRADALESLGLLDESFFAYHEEVEWCARARRAGWRVRYCPQAIVSHTGRGSHGSPSAIRIRKYFAARNAILFARKHAGPLERAKLAAFLATSLPLQLLWHLPRGAASDVVLKIRGVRDALLGRRPPFEELGLLDPPSDPGRA